MTTQDKITLYIATHNITGLKYFGMTKRFFTESELQNNYLGSGIYWKRHLTKHGKDVTMKIYKVCDTLTVENIAVKFSLENKIVESAQWANLCIEDGLDGGNIGFKHSFKSIIKQRDSRRTRCTELGIGWNEQALKSINNSLVIDGVETTIKTEMIRKANMTKSKEIILDDGTVTSINKEKAKVMTATRKSKGNYHPKGNRTAKKFKYTSPIGEEFIIFNTSDAFCKSKNIAIHLFFRTADNTVIIGPKVIKKNTPQIVLNTIGWKRELI